MYTQEQLTELEEAIARGVLTVRHRDGTSMTYQSLDAMRKVRADMLRDIEKAAGRRRPRVARFYEKGTGL